MSEFQSAESTSYELKPILSKTSEMHLRRTNSTLSTASYEHLLDSTSRVTSLPYPSKSVTQRPKFAPFKGRFRGKRPIRVVIAIISMVGTIAIVLTDVFVKDMQNDVLHVIC